MKFCQICGRPLNEGEVCSCQSQQQAAPQQPQRQQYQQPERAQHFEQPQRQQHFEQPQRPQQPQRQQYPQRAASPRPSQENKFSKAFNNLPIAFRSYFKNSEKVVGTAKAKKDIILPLMYIAIFFTVVLIVGICFFARMTSYTYSAGLGNLSGVFGAIGSRFNFGLVLLSAIIMTVFTCFLYVSARFVAQMIFAKKSALQALIDSLIEFGFHSMVPSALLIVGALLGLITAWLLVPFVGLSIAYLLVMYVTTTLKEAEGYRNKLVVTIVLTVTVMLTFALGFWMLYLMCRMNYSASYMDYYGQVADYLNQLS